MQVLRTFGTTRAFTLLILLSVFFGCSPEDGEDGTDGLNGVNGLNSALQVVVEQPGTNCPNGGYKIGSGLDLNRNGQLDNEEITQEEFICNLTEPDFPYTNYVSLISQSNDENPTSSVLVNTLELNISWVRQSAGIYVGTLDKNIDLSKTVIFYSTPNTHTNVRGEVVSQNSIQLELQNGINFFQDNFDNLSFEIREYE
ncbi:DUF7151 family protein [Flagellimonas sp. 2504JD4-2]